MIQISTLCFLSVLSVFCIHSVVHAQTPEQFDLQVWTEHGGKLSKAARLSSNSEGCMAWFGSEAKIVSEDVCRKALPEFLKTIAETPKAVPSTQDESIYTIQLQTQMGKQTRRVPYAASLALSESVMNLLGELK